MGMKEDDDLVQENLQEYIHDDNKIVTCKWLSLTLSIPVNSAKLALYRFVDVARQTGNNDDINVTYFVSGFETKDCGTKTLKCVVVPESHLDSIKQTMEPVTSCHVYSVQKAKLKDYTPLYQTDYDICRENADTLSKFSSIACPWAQLREDQPVEKQVVKTSANQKTGEKEKETQKPTSLPAKEDNQKVAPGNKKAGIASMFAAAGKKKTEPNPVSADSKNPTSSHKPAETGTKKGIQSMFKGQAAKAVKKEKETSPKQADTAHKPDTKQKTQKKTEKTQKHKLSGSDEPQKKRRRIRNDLFDSSDEEGAQTIDDDDNNVDVEMSEEEDDDAKDNGRKADEAEEEKKVDRKDEDDDCREKKQKQTIVVKDGKRRKRTRKLVPRQHIDEDGFMVTEKVWESDSTDASDEEETTVTISKPSSTSSPSSPTKARNSAKPAASKANKKKPTVSPPNKNKQASLMSFFKKK